jgi:ribosomal protein S27AE
MEIKCPMCGSADMDEPKRIRCGATGDHLAYVARNGWFGGKLVMHGRACKRCGHVAMAVSVQRLLEELEKAKK